MAARSSSEQHQTQQHSAVVLLSSVLSCWARAPVLCCVNKLSACSACTRRSLRCIECTGCTVKVREQNKTAARTAAFLSFYYGAVVRAGHGSDWVVAVTTSTTHCTTALYVLFKRRTFVLLSVLPELALHHTETNAAKPSCMLWLSQCMQWRHRNHSTFVKEEG